RLALKPVVLTLARLFAVTVIWVCCASRPVLAAQSAGSMGSVTYGEERGCLGGAQPEDCSNLVEACAFSSAVCRAFTCMSKCRASSIMFTIALAMLTLLDSSVPEVTVVAASATTGSGLV